jgi:16S rRNA (cytidine1402-2'-O)-methyltransferase
MLCGGTGDGAALCASEPGWALIVERGASGVVTTSAADGDEAGEAADAGAAGGIIGGGGIAGGVRAETPVAARCCASDNADGPAQATSAAAAATAIQGRARDQAGRGGIERECAKVTDAEALSAQPGTLYVVATPVGNLRDITLRAIDLLGSVDVIAAEDTRVSTVLLRHYGIATRPVSLHQHNEGQRASRVVEWLRTGKSVALVSDAGTPAVSDPGARLVAAVHSAGMPVVPVPGANAAVAAVSAAGLDAERFVFLGFLPAQAKARRELLALAAKLPWALVIYEAPHRVRATAGQLVDVLDPRRTLIVVREVTKKFETIVRMPLGESGGWFAADANHERGEFVLLIDAPLEVPATGDEAASFDARRLVAALIDELPPARAARVAAAATGMPRDALYALALALKVERR